MSISLLARPSALARRGGPTAGVLALYALVVIALLLAVSLPFATDYVGGDNDDTMRLVMVRDLLSGQGWFDTVQYRLGLAGGTPMHWSRPVHWRAAGKAEAVLHRIEPALPRKQVAHHDEPHRVVIVAADIIGGEGQRDREQQRDDDKRIEGEDAGRRSAAPREGGWPGKKRYGHGNKPFVRRLKPAET